MMSQVEKKRVALTSLVASFILTSAKFVVALFSGSLALLSEATHSLFDMFSTIMTMFAVNISAKPADDSHPYGHGKIENITALGEAILLLITSVLITYAAVGRLINNEHDVEFSYWLFGVLIFSIVIDGWRARALFKVGKDTNSQALKANALHFLSDMASSFIALIGIFFVYLGTSWADSVAAIFVSLFVAAAALRLAYGTINPLMDAAPQGAANRIAEVLFEIEKILDVPRIRVRQIGNLVFVDLLVTVSRAQSLEAVAALRNEVSEAVGKLFEEVEITIEFEPLALEDENIIEQIHIEANNLNIAVHHVTIHKIDEKLAVSMHVEMDGDYTLLKAHEQATELEVAVAQSLGPQVEVDTHIEPMVMHEQWGNDVSNEHGEAIMTMLASATDQNSIIFNIHDIRVHESDLGLHVIFHCNAEPETSLKTVHHAIDDMERKLLTDYPGVVQVEGHAEPPYVLH